MTKDSYASLYKSGSLWVDEFKMIEIMRQKGDSEFCELLCRIRTATHTAILKGREITPDMPDYPNHALHVYRIDADV